MPKTGRGEGPDEETVAEAKSTFTARRRITGLDGDRTQRLDEVINAIRARN